MTPAVADFVSFVVVHHPILGCSILIHIHAENIYCTFFGLTGSHRRWAWIWKGKSTLDLWVVHGWTWLSGIIRSGPGSNRIPATRPRLRRNLINGWTMTFRYSRGHVLLFAGSMFDFWRVNHADPLKIPPKETNFQTTQQHREDLRVGTVLQIYGRNIYITDCDPFTRCRGRRDRATLVINFQR
jgi:hypothetical protein